MPAAWRSTSTALAREYRAARRRGRPPDPARVDSLRRQLRAQRAADYLGQVLDASPALTAEDLRGLAELLLDAARPLKNNGTVSGAIWSSCRSQV